MDENLITGDPSAPAVDNNQPQAQQPEEQTHIVVDNNEDYSEGIPVKPIEEEAPAPVEEPAKEPEQKPVAPPTPTPEPVKQEPVVATEEPVFQPTDYSFEVTLGDGTTLKIENPDDVKKLDKETDFGTPANFLDFQSKYSRMVNGIESDKKEFDTKKAEWESQKEARESTEKQVQTLVSEVEYLESKGFISPVDDKFKNVSWAEDQEALKDEGVKQRLELLDYRQKENESREKLGLPPMGIIEAFNQRKLEQYEEERVKKKNEQADLTKKRGAMVSAPSASPQDGIPDDVIIGVGGSVRDISNVM